MFFDCLSDIPLLFRAHKVLGFALRIISLAMDPFSVHAYLFATFASLLEDCLAELKPTIRVWLAG